MQRRSAAFLSFRLGGRDGVSVETRKWEWALGELGFHTRRIAGELSDGLRPDDVWIPFLAIDPVPGASVEPDVLAAAIAGADLVVVENLCSLPLNLAASTTAIDVLARHPGRVVFHHHDLASERPALAHLRGFPPNRPNSLHVTINDAARRTLAKTGITAVIIRNAFDTNPNPGDRAATRTAFGFGIDDLVVLQPTRAIPRKQVHRGIELAEALAILLPDRSPRYWLTGPAEEGFETELQRLVEASTVPVTRGWADRVEDAYAAADLVVFPSSLEGFGNPVIEATIAGRLVAAGDYPVLDELTDLGLEVLAVDDPEGIAGALRHPDAERLAANRAWVHQHLDLADLPDRIRHGFATVAWDLW